MFIRKILNALFYSLSGVKYLLKERAFVQELLLGIVLCICMLYGNNSTLEKLYIFSSYCLILIAEAFNTCIETVVNRISLDKHPMSKKAKDIGSAAVFLTIMHFVIVIIAVNF